MKFNIWSLVFFLAQVSIPVIGNAQEPLLVPVGDGTITEINERCRVETIVLRLTRSVYSGLVREKIEKMGYEMADLEILESWAYSDPGVKFLDEAVAEIATHYLDPSEGIWYTYRYQFFNLHGEFWDIDAVPWHFLVYKKVLGPRI